MKIVFFGSDPWSILVLKQLEEKFDVQAVVCAPGSPIANYFKGPILTPERLDSNFLSELKTHNPSLFVVASYGKIIPQNILDIPRNGALNIHPSLLPKYRGASPVPTTILNGDKTTGVTIIKMDEKMDHGPIVSTKKISLSGQEDFNELINKLFQEGADLLIKILPDFIKGKIKLTAQNHQAATFTKLLRKEDGFFEISSPPTPEKLDKMVRALNPWPGVWTNWNGKVVKFLPKNMMQIEGKKPVIQKVFQNGYPNFPINLQLQS